MSRRGLFGWSLPPGCGSLPGEDEPDPHPKSIELYEILEAAGVSQDVIDKAVGIVDELAWDVECLENKECPHCAARQQEQERKDQEDFEREFAKDSFGSDR